MKHFLILSLSGLLCVGGCETTPDKPIAPTVEQTQTQAQTTTQAPVDAYEAIVKTWNSPDEHLYLSKWPGKMQIKGNLGVIREFNRVRKLYKADIPEPYASLYSKDEYMIKAFRQTRSILGSYTKNVTPELEKAYLDSPWAKRTLRAYYVNYLAAECDVALTEEQKERLNAYELLKGPSPQLYSCAGNPELKELDLPK